MDIDLVPILADAIKGYYEDSEIFELCDIYGINLSYDDNNKPAYMRLARDLIVGIGDPQKRSFLNTIVQSLLNRAREGAGKSKWDRQEYHRAMVDNLTEMQTQFERITSTLSDSEEYENLLVTAEEVASLLRTDIKTVITFLESGELDGFKIGNDWRVRKDSINIFLNNRITDQRMSSLTSNLQKPEIWARELKNFPGLKKQIAETDYDEGSLGAFLKTIIDENRYEQKGNNSSSLITPDPINHSEVKPMPDPKKVFVVHGRDDNLRRDFFAFLRALDLKPLEWSEALKLTKKASPYIGEVLDQAFDNAQAIAVLLTPDDEVRLISELWSPDEDESEKEFRLQPRPNVLFEAGMAFGRNPNRTLLIEVGRVKAFSDVAGRHVIRLTDSPENRQDVAERLQTAGCSVSTSGRDWMKQGKFSINRDKVPPVSEIDQQELSVKWVDLQYPDDVGLLSELESQGYRARWCQEDKLARRLDIEGWLLVTHTTESGKKVVLKVKDRPQNQTLIMKKDS